MKKMSSFEKGDWIMAMNFSIGNLYWDWGVTANIQILEWNRRSSMCKAKIVETGITYIARLEHLEAKR
ncbi:MAG: hypothetical protein EOO52_13095 [Gammaproteobacteria bacterium]|nr:MAG: hypothetical protein EOO52_13095 [Gammaproteobacteria bacterium]